MRVARPEKHSHSCSTVDLEQTSPLNKNASMRIFRNTQEKIKDFGNSVQLADLDRLHVFPWKDLPKPQESILTRIDATSNSQRRMNS